MGFIRRGSRVFLIRREGESQNSASAEIKSAVTERQLIRQRRNEIQQQQQQHHQQQHRSNRIGTPPQQPPHHQPDQQPLQHHRSDSLEVLTTDLDFYECTFSPDTYRPKAPVPPFTPGTSSPVDHAPADTPTDTTTTMSPGNRYSSDNYDRCVVSLLHGHKRHLLVTSMTSEEIGDRLTVAHMQKAVSKVTGIPCHRQHLVVGTTRLDLNPGAILSDMALTEKTLVRVQSTNAQNFAKNEEHFSKTMWLAPQLGDHQMYHVMIIVTTPINDDVIRLVDSIKTKLESEEIGLRCHLYSRNELQSDLDNYLDVIQITSKFLCVEVDSNEQDSWPSLPWQHTLILETTPTLKHAHNPSNARLSPVGPHLQILNLTDNIDWWIKLLDFLQIFPSFDLVTNRLCDKRISENGRLLVSLKSHWRFLGRELITDQLPEELLKTEIPEMVYRESVEHLMKGTKFRYHVICYNAPFAVILFSAILGICIVVDV